MPTGPSKTVARGIAVLSLLAKSNGRIRTVNSLHRQAPHLTPGQIEGALLAYLEAGIVQSIETEAGLAFALLGTFHLELALAEVEALLRPLQQSDGILRKIESFDRLQLLLRNLGSKGAQ